MHKVDSVNNHLVVLSVELLIQLAQLVKLLFLVEVAQTKLFLENLNEPVILLEECIPVSEIANSESDSKCFTGVSGTNTAFSSSEDLTSSLLLSSDLLGTIRLDLYIRNNVCSA